MQSWMINPQNGDYVMDASGRPVETDELTNPAYIRLRTRRKGWLYAPDDKYGSDLNQLKKLKSGGGATSVENLTAKALTPLVEDGRATDVEVNATQQVRGGLATETIITDATGQPQKLVLPPVGV